MSEPKHLQRGLFCSQSHPPTPVEATQLLCSYPCNVLLNKLSLGKGLPLTLTPSGSQSSRLGEGQN